MNRFLSLISFFLFCEFSTSFGQTPAVAWQKCLGGNNGDYAWSVEPTTDGGFIVAGYTEGLDNADIMGYHGNVGNGDIWITKTDNVGNIQWQKCLGGTFFETGASIHQTADGGYIVAGTSASVDCSITGNHGGTDYWVVKLNSKGDVVWQKLYGGSQNEYAYSLSPTVDGGYIVTGETESSNGDITVNHGQRDYWVIKIDGSGNLIWQKSLGGSGMDESYGVQATPDGGGIVAGYTESNDGDVTGNHGNRDYWVVKLDNAGNIQWQKALGGSNADLAWSVQLTTDGGYAVAGYTASNNGDVSGNHIGAAVGFSDYWVVKLNSAGIIQWQKCYGGNFNEIAYYIQPTQDGGFFVAGSAESSDGDLTCNNAGLTDMWVIKIDGSGNLKWQKNLGGELYDEAHCVKELSDGTCIVAGYTCSKIVSGFHKQTNIGTCADFWLVKLSTPLSAAPNPVVTIDPASANVCAGIPATITTTALYAGINTTYQWTRNGVTVGGNSSSYTASDFANNDNVVCKITTGGLSCEPTVAQATDAVTIKINTNVVNPLVTISADNTFICNCTTITFKASVTNGGASPVYQWKVNGVNAGNNKNLFVTNMLKAGDVITCAYSDNTSCVAGGSALSNSIKIDPGTSSPPSVNITVSADTICTGSTVTFTANPVNAGTNPGYQWKVNGTSAGTNNSIFTNYVFSQGDVVTCSITTDPSFPCATTGNAISNGIKMTVTNKGLPSVNISTLSNSICVGSIATFSATTNNAGSNPSYQWKVNGVNTGTNNKNFTTSSLSDADIVSCTITTDPFFTCALSPTATSNNIAVTVKAQLAPSLTISASVNDVCAGTAIAFTADAQNAGLSPSYQWILNNASLSNSTAVFTSNTLSNGDALYCLLTPGNDACSTSPISSNTIVAIIEDLPTITISPADTIITVGQQVRLNTTVTGNISTYQWDPSNKLENALTLSPSTIHLTDNTTYSLTVESDKGCQASAIAIVKVGKPLLMPNAFTPNGDGVNDVFRIAPGVSLQLKEFSIFDRWGNMVFTTNQIGKGWDGILNGIPANSGTYVYYIKGINEKGTVFLKSTVELIR